MTDLRTDAKTCGRCAMACPMNLPVCVGGMCVAAAKALQGSFIVGDGPAVGTNPQVISCVERCAVKFGGLAADYWCSTKMSPIDRKAFVDGFGDFAHCASTPVADTYKKGTNYSFGTPP